MAHSITSIATNEQFQWLADRIAEGYQPEKIWLFGSYAHGNPTADSDLDLLIVKETDESPARRYASVRQLLRGFDWPLDILVYTPEEFENRVANKSYFLQTALSNARLLYAKP